MFSFIGSWSNLIFFVSDETSTTFLFKHFIKIIVIITLDLINCIVTILNVIEGVFKNFILPYFMCNTFLNFTK